MKNVVEYWGQSMASGSLELFTLHYNFLVHDLYVMHIQLSLKVK